MVVDPAAVPPASAHAEFIDAARAAMATERAADGFPADVVEGAGRLSARMSAGAAPAALRSHAAAIAAAAAIDLDIPTASAVPGGSRIKAGLKRAMDWYLRYLASQLGDLGATMSRFGGATAAELERIDAELADLRDEVRAVQRDVDALRVERAS